MRERRKIMRRCWKSSSPWKHSGENPSSFRVSGWQAAKHNLSVCKIHNGERLNRKVQSFFIPATIRSSTSQSDSFKRASIEIKRFLKESVSLASAPPMKAAISSSLVICKNISPSPVRNHRSFTLNSLQIKEIAASLGSLRPNSYVATVFLFTFILSANSCCVKSKRRRICFIRSFSVGHLLISK